MQDAVILDGMRSAIGKHRGALSGIRADDLASYVLGALLDRNPEAKGAVEEVVFGATNQAGEDNRNVARMALLLADLPYEVTGVTVCATLDGKTRTVPCSRTPSIAIGLPTRSFNWRSPPL